MPRDINLNWIEFQKWLEQEPDGSPYIAVIKSEVGRRMQQCVRNHVAGPGRPRGSKNKPGHGAGRPKLRNAVAQ